MTRKLFFLFPCLLEEFTLRKVHSKEDFKFVLWSTRFMCVRVFQHFLSSYLLLISCKAFTLIYDTVLNITDNLAKTCHIYFVRHYGQPNCRCHSSHDSCESDWFGCMTYKIFFRPLFYCKFFSTKLPNHLLGENTLEIHFFFLLKAVFN